jgi:hypothetical protein
MCNIKCTTAHHITKLKIGKEAMGPHDAVACSQPQGCCLLLQYLLQSCSRGGWDPWAPEPGLQIPDGLVVRSCTSHPGVLGSIPKREEPGKTGAPCVIVPLTECRR